MRPGFWMHENGMDCCIEVIRVQYSDQKRIIVKARWWNLGYTGNPWLIDPRVETIKLNRQDLSKWHNITNKMTTPRKASGMPA